MAAPDLIALTGAPGSGKTTAARALEAEGYVRLTPGPLLWTVADGHRARGRRVVIDGAHSEDVAELHARGGVLVGIGGPRREIDPDARRRPAPDRMLWNCGMAAALEAQAAALAMETAPPPPYPCAAPGALNRRSLP